MIEREDIGKFIETIKKTEEEKLIGVSFFSEMKLYDLVEAIQYYAREDAIKEIYDRLMPEGMTWPRFEDGEPVNFGDIIDRNKYCEVDANFVVLSLDGSCYGLLSDYDGELHEAGERIKRPEPKQDTLQDVIDDCKKSAYEYWNCAGIGCDHCPSRISGEIPVDYYNVTNCRIAKDFDIKRRLEEIQERMGGDQQCQN